MVEINGHWFCGKITEFWAEEDGKGEYDVFIVHEGEQRSFHCPDEATKNALLIRLMQEV